jgi:hypothetical protein
MLWVVRTSWTPTKPSSTWPRQLAKADMSKRQPSSKEKKAYTATVASNLALAAAAAALDSDYSTCHASLHGCVFDQEFVPHARYCT